MKLTLKHSGIVIGSLELDERARDSIVTVTPKRGASAKRVRQIS
ncbi:MAG TPA: hypothetical protein VHI99_23420 [Vicinamibacterales bacterium]|jgi:hypothetical protein|nr:hypothetical protein [Vicinamibacterales bacterium]